MLKVSVRESTSTRILFLHIRRIYVCTKVPGTPQKGNNPTQPSKNKPCREVGVTSQRKLTTISDLGISWSPSTSNRHHRSLSLKLNSLVVTMNIRSGMETVSVSTADKTASEVRKGAGNEYTRQKNYTKATKEYKAGIVLDPTNPKIWSTLALCYEHVGDWTQWKEAAQRTVDLEPSWFKGYVRLTRPKKHCGNSMMQK